MKCIYIYICGTKGETIPHHAREWRRFKMCARDDIHHQVTLFTHVPLPFIYPAHRIECHFHLKPYPHACILYLYVYTYTRVNTGIRIHISFIFYFCLCFSPSSGRISLDLDYKLTFKMDEKLKKCHSHLIIILFKVI